MVEDDNCRKNTGTQATIAILPEQAECLEQHGCFVAKICRCESLPPGHPVIVTYGNQKREVVVVGIQEVPSDKKGPDKQDFYVFALKENVNVVE